MFTGGVDCLSVRGCHFASNHCHGSAYLRDPGPDANGSPNRHSAQIGDVQYSSDTAQETYEVSEYIKR